MMCAVGPALRGHSMTSIYLVLAAAACWAVQDCTGLAAAARWAVRGCIVLAAAARWAVQGCAGLPVRWHHCGRCPHGHCKAEAKERQGSPGSLQLWCCWGLGELLWMRARCESGEHEGQSTVRWWSMSDSIWLLLRGSMEQGRAWHCCGAGADSGPGRLWAVPAGALGLSVLGSLAGRGPMFAAAHVLCGSAACRLLSGPAAAPHAGWAPGLLLWGLSFRASSRPVPGAATALLFQVSFRLQCSSSPG